MGTVVREGAGSGVVVRTGLSTVFGQIAIRLGERLPQTAFQVGLRNFSLMLVAVAAVLTISIFVINVVLRHPFFDALLFSLAIAIGLTPQLLPAIVTVSLSTGAQRLARLKVLVKRLVSIEDPGNIEVLFTDKTGTLTEGRIRFAAAVDATGAPSAAVLQLGLLCNVERMDDAQLAGAPPHTTIFARVSPDQKSRIIRIQQKRGADVGFLGDGVNDAVAISDGPQKTTSTDSPYIHEAHPGYIRDQNQLDEFYPIVLTVSARTLG
jgi:magnesium-transporting ATPase (P-type)